MVLNDLEETYYVLGIQILCNRPSGIMRFSQCTYIKRTLKMFNMQSCSSDKAPIVKGDRFSKSQCPWNDIKRDRIKVVLYSSIVGSLMYAQVCTCPYIAFVVGMLGRCLSDLGQSHWKVTKKGFRYLQGIKDLMLTYRLIDTLEVVGFSNSNYAGCVNDKQSTSASYLYDG